MLLDLWKTSGHANFYRENMFGALEVEKADYQLKPMNCPGHILIYKSHLRSYRELPYRLAELGTVYRYERSGVLHGLLRVRGFTQDDAHIFCMPSQIEDEVAACVDFAWAVMNTFGFSRLSGGAFRVGSAAPGKLRRLGRRLAARHAGAGQHARSAENTLQTHGGGGGVLRAEDRREADRCDRAPLAAHHRAIRFQFAGALRPRVRRRRRQPSPAADGAPRAVGLGRALLRHPDRALCGRVSAVARAGASGRAAGQRQVQRVRQASGGGANRRGLPRAISTTATKSCRPRSATRRCKKFRT